MATLIIRNIEDALLAQLKARAPVHGCSVEEEIRQILRWGLTSATLGRSQGFRQAMRAIFKPLGGLDLPEIPREPPRGPPDFAEAG